MWLARSLLVILSVFFLPVGCMVAAHYTTDDNLSWSSLRRDSSAQAPAVDSSDAVIQVYAARAARWRGAFGVHTWIAAKRAGEQHYTRFEVIGYMVYWGGDGVRVGPGMPDAYWYGNRPTLLRDLRGGEQVDALIDRLFDAAEVYPYNNVYHVWPGPNSNTFIAHLARSVPQLRLELPSTAIGKDYLPLESPVSMTPSGTGAQLSIGGYAGVLAGIEEGLELNLLGLTVGIDLYPPAIKLPGFGRFGFSDYKRQTLKPESDEGSQSAEHISPTAGPG